jgi:hypothetical protein
MLLRRGELARNGETPRCGKAQSRVLWCVAEVTKELADASKPIREPQQLGKSGISVRKVRKASPEHSRIPMRTPSNSHSLVLAYPGWQERSGKAYTPMRQLPQHVGRPRLSSGKSPHGIEAHNSDRGCSKDRVYPFGEDVSGTPFIRFSGYLVRGGARSLKFEGWKAPRMYAAMTLKGIRGGFRLVP